MEVSSFPAISRNFSIQIEDYALILPTKLIHMRSYPYTDSLFEEVGEWCDEFVSEWSWKYVLYEMMVEPYRYPGDGGKSSPHLLPTIFFKNNEEMLLFSLRWI